AKSERKSPALQFTSLLIDLPLETPHLGFESLYPVFQCIDDLSRVKTLARNSPSFPKTETSDSCSCWFLSAYAPDLFHYAILTASA
ncbi:MAG: hypothetical protein ACRECF_11895, partial [Methyloceanibacter sp.]